MTAFNRLLTKKGTPGIQWLHKHCIMKLPIGERVHKRDHLHRDHFHNKRCALCLHTVEDDDHIFRCTIKVRKIVDPILCDILQEGLVTYFNGKLLPNAMLRIRRQENKRYGLLIDEQFIIGSPHNEKYNRKRI